MHNDLLVLLNSSGADQDQTSAALTSARPSASEEVPPTAADSAAAHLLAELSSTEPLVSLASTVDHQPTDVVGASTAAAAGGGSSSAQEIKIPEQLISPEVVSLVVTAVTAASDPAIDVGPTTGNVDPSGDPIGDDETTMMSTLSTIEEQPELGYQVRKRSYLLTPCVILVKFPH